VNELDNASGSPQTLKLNGTVQDFVFSPAPGSSPSATVEPGQPAHSPFGR